MRIFASVSDRTLNTDPAPWLYPSGLRSQAYIHTGPAPAYAPRPEYTPARAHAANPILTAFRENNDGWEGTTHEWLFQLARHWAAWQSPRIGTFPLDYRDPAGPATRAISEECGEDTVYWEISDVIRDLLDRRGAETFDSLEEPDGWGFLDFCTAGHYAQDAIVHAVAVLSRLDLLYAATPGHGI